MTDRVGVNLLWLVPGVVGGSEESTVRALEAVATAVESGEADLDVVLFVLPELVGAHPRLVERLETVVAPIGGGAKGLRVSVETTWLAAATRRAGVDLVHHAGGVVPLGAPRPVTLTIHDTQPLDLPANFSAVKRSYLRAMSGRSARRAEVVAVPSAFTASRVRELFGVGEDRVSVVPWSAPEPTIDGDPDDAARLGALAEDGPLFLYPAISYPHKHHEALLYAFAELSSRVDGARLVFCGRPGPLDDHLRDRAASAGVGDRVSLLGRVDGGTLEALYRRATAVVYPSRYEGFGLPVLEAMSRGRPVIASDIPAIAEVAGDAAILVDPPDLAAWAAAMERVATDPATAAWLSAAGTERAATFTPTRTAEGLLDVWRLALARS